VTTRDLTKAACQFPVGDGRLDFGEYRSKNAMTVVAIECVCFLMIVLSIAHVMLRHVSLKITSVF